VKRRQLELADKSPAFAMPPGMDRLARTMVEAIGDALLRRFGSYEAAAAALDAVFGPQGRPVSGSTLRACFSGVERNYPRLEWAALVLDDPLVVMALTPKRLTPEEELRMLREHLAHNARGELERFDRRVAAQMVAAEGGRG
jgi:hypothetical protein